MKTTKTNLLRSGSGLHTSAPWIISVHNQRRSIEAVSDEEPNKILAELTYENDEANAQLIVAAPEMLEQLKFLVRKICECKREPTVEDCDEAKAVIAKAMGEEGFDWE